MKVVKTMLLVAVFSFRLESVTGITTVTRIRRVTMKRGAVN